jgi:diguanylate cyclase (GGDEF)-like protein
MPIDSSNLRNIIKPQDGVTILITLLGVVIAIFLPDSIIKLIGGSIALLAGVALYITIAQRMNDRVQLQTRRTTLPPPSFKTRVTQDPATSAKRIVFDDYQQAFNPADDDLPDAWGGDDSDFTKVSRDDRDPASNETSIRTAMRGEGRQERGEDEEIDAFAGSAGESFRVVTPRKKSEQADPVELSTPSGDASVPLVAQAPSVQPPVEQPVIEEVGVALSEPEIAPAQKGKRRIDARPGIQAALDLPTLEEGSSPPEIEPAPPVIVEELEPVTVTGPIEEVRAELVAMRRQAQVVLQELFADSDEEVKESEPRAEFVRLVGQLLNAMARSIQARSIVFCWVNLEKKHLIPEAKLTTGSYGIRLGVRIPLGSDVVSQIARSGIPEIITDISPAAERELIPYYVGSANTRSFVGVPVFFRREVVGVLLADSTDENAFDEGSVATLAEYTRLVSGMIRGYTEKYDLHLIAKTLDTFESLHRGMAGATLDPANVARVLAERVSQLFDSLYVAVVLFDEEEREWEVAAVASETMEGTIRGIRPDMSSSLIGRSTRYAEEIYLERIDQEARFSPDEPLGEGGAFLALPLIATTKCYGTLVIEHPSPSAYIPRDVDLLRDLVRYAAMAIEVFNVNRAIETQIVLDESTGLYNSGFLLATLEHEVLRARDFRSPLSFALISVDIPPSLRGDRDAEEVIVGSIGSVVGSTLRSYDTLGRYDSNTFGVVLVGRNDQDAYLWAEKLRKDVASRILTLGPRKISVTISAGISDVSDLSKDGSVLDGARQALAKARSGDGNAVILY